MLSVASFVDLSYWLLRNASNCVSASTLVLYRDPANRIAIPSSEGFPVYQSSALEEVGAEFLT